MEDIECKNRLVDGKMKFVLYLKNEKNGNGIYQ